VVEAKAIAAGQVLPMEAETEAKARLQYRESEQTELPARFECGIACCLFIAQIEIWMTDFRNLILRVVVATLGSKSSP
jgi:hypothetical protein